MIRLDIKIFKNERNFEKIFFKCWERFEENIKKFLSMWTWTKLSGILKNTRKILWKIRKNFYEILELINEKNFEKFL